jgi:uroporphyrinogen-III decarboxylase
LNAYERVKKAIRIEKPDRTPILLYNRDFDESDLIITEVIDHWGGSNKDVSEWGFVWEKHDGTMGQPKDALIKSWSDIGSLRVPRVDDWDRYGAAAGAIKKYPEKYHVASLALTGFTVMTILRGFSEVLEGLYLEPENTNRLAELVFDFESSIIEGCAGKGFHAIGFFDDWGTQNGLIISPDTWRDIFKPRYKKQFDRVHELGMNVYFHCCGQIETIIPDLIETGVDILNLSQPNVFDIKALGRKYAGKVCFLCPISYQTTSLTGTKEDIYAEAKNLIENLGTEDGGFIGYVEEYNSIGLSEENYQNCVNAFREKGKIHH